MKKKLTKIYSEKRRYLHTFKHCLKGTVENRALASLVGGIREITLTIS